jgi:hypothetical protein
MNPAVSDTDPAFLARAPFSKPALGVRSRLVGLIHVPFLRTLIIVAGMHERPAVTHPKARFAGFTPAISPICDLGTRRFRRATNACLMVDKLSG